MLAPLVLTVLISAALVAVMVRVGALDHPGARSSHTRPTPKGGGVGIAVGTACGLIVAAGGHVSRSDAALLAAALALAGFSYLDDVRQYRFWLKLLAQAGAALLAVAAGGGAPDHIAIGDWSARLGPWGGVIGFVWIMGVTNAVNFMDGLNGLAAGASAIACSGYALARPEAGLWPEIVAASVFGFLPFNFPHARIFMGDVGSQFLGFVVAVLALRAAQAPAGSLIIPAALLPLLADVAFTMVRRWRAGERLTEPHRGHVYQLAQRTGVSATYVTLAVWCAVALGAAAGDLRSFWMLAALCAALAVGGAAIQKRARMAGLIAPSV